MTSWGYTLSSEEHGPQDLVAIAGKGHEGTQTIREKKLPFDDRVVAREILRDLGRLGGGSHAHP